MARILSCSYWQAWQTAAPCWQAPVSKMISLSADEVALVVSFCNFELKYLLWSVNIPSLSYLNRKTYIFRDKITTIVVRTLTTGSLKNPQFVKCSSVITNQTEWQILQVISVIHEKCHTANASGSSWRLHIYSRLTGHILVLPANFRLQTLLLHAIHLSQPMSKRKIG